MTSLVSNRSVFVKYLIKSISDIRAFKQIRQNSTPASRLLYSEFGDPVKVVSKDNFDIPKLDCNDILVRMIASPVNPADINTIQGKYPSKPALPAVPGNEGIGEVIQVGNAVKTFTAGDRVVPLKNNLGTWRTHAVFDCKSLYKVPKELGVVEAATFTVNPCTAYRMLKDYVQLTPEDTVIQNGANSACGQNVIQLCKIFGLKSVNIVRNRPEINELKDFLRNLGATYVLTEEELRTTDIFKKEQVKRPKLALNCVGGKNALEVLRHLNHGGTMVTYGGMSREPVTVPTSALIFKNVSLRGFWMTQWTYDNYESDERWNMFNELIWLMIAGKLQGPAYTMVPFNKYQDALLNTMTVQGYAGKKYILDFVK